MNIRKLFTKITTVILAVVMTLGVVHVTARAAEPSLAVSKSSDGTKYEIKLKDYSVEPDYGLSFAIWEDEKTESDGASYDANDDNIAEVPVSDISHATKYDLKVYYYETSDKSTKAESGVTLTFALYTVTWKNEDGTVLETDEDVLEGGKPSYDGTEPSKAATPEYTYKFDGWDKDTNSAITDDTVFTATYTSEKNKYTVTWKNDDGTELDKDEDVEYGTTPSFDQADPTKTATAQYTYEFNGWSPEVSAITGDTVYTAQYKPIVNTYTITWKNEDGSVLEIDEDVEHGKTPSYNGSKPTKSSTKENTYEFSGWSPSVATVTGNQTYTAQFSNTKNKYTVTWKNEDGTVLKTDSVQYGTMPSYTGSTPTKAETLESTFTFDKWSPAVTAVTGNTTYTATFKKTAKAAYLKHEFTDTVQSKHKVSLINHTLGSGETFLAAVWSDSNGQDDLKWTTLSKESASIYSATINASDYKHSGLFYCHVYKKDAKGNYTFVDGFTFKVPGFKAGNLVVKSIDKSKGTAVLTLEGATAPVGIDYVRVAVWSTSNQSNLKWYDMKRDGSSWTATMDLSNHQSIFAVYNAHAYAMPKNGTLTYAGGVSVDMKMQAGTLKETINTAKANYTLDLTGFSAPQDAAEMRVAVWSAQGGQDDLKWYTMKKNGSNWSVTNPLSDIKHTGTIYAHVYMTKKDGSGIFVNGLAFELKAAKSTGMTGTYDASTGAIKIDITGVTSDFTIKNIKVAVWSEKDQSNLKWYTATNAGSGTYTVNGNISNHKYIAGTYYAHAYVELTNGFNGFLNGATISVASSGDIKYADKYAGTANSEQKTYTLTAENLNIPGGVVKAEFVVKNGSTEKTYTASGSGSKYSADVNISDFKLYGQYTADLYITNKAGVRYKFKSAKVMNVTGKPTVEVSVSSKNETAGTFTIKLANYKAPSGVAKLEAAVWIKSNQSDLKWVTLTKQSDGSYTNTVNISEHDYDSGNYIIHVYATMGNGIKDFAGGLSYSFKPSNIVYVQKTKTGERTVGITTPSSTSNLRFAVWSETGGQDDLVWYGGSGNALKMTATVKGSNHKHSGKFIVHVYSGSTFLGGTTFTMDASELKTGWYYENGYKFYYQNGAIKTDLTGMVSGPFIAKVNRTCCVVTIYAKDGSNGYIIPVRAMACSVGLPTADMETPVGTFYTDAKYRWKMLMGPSYGQYATHIWSGVYFHSVAGSNMTSYNLSAAEYNRLGSPASHGCVRLNVRDAKWIYDNCALGMQVTIYDSSYPGPFGKPDTIKIPASQNWDPTDPNI